MLDAHEVALTGPERRALHLTIDLAVRERFAGALAHDLRQPVSNIAMGAQLILRLNPPPEIAAWAGRILRSGERMATMLKELLEALAIQSAAGASACPMCARWRRATAAARWCSAMRIPEPCS